MKYLNCTYHFHLFDNSISEEKFYAILFNFSELTLFSKLASSSCNWTSSKNSLELIADRARLALSAISSKLFLLEVQQG